MRLDLDDDVQVASGAAAWAHLALTVAARAAGHVHDLAEDRLRGATDLATAPALRAGLRRCAGLGAAALAGATGLGSGKRQLAFDAENRLFEGKSKVEPEIRPPAWAGAGPAARGGAEEHVEDVVDPAEAGPVEARHPLGGIAEGVAT